MVHLAGTPTLETERLILRAPGPQDWETCRDFLCSDRARYVGGPYDLGAAWRLNAAEIGHWVARGWGSFILCLKGTDAGIGLAGPWYPANWPEREIGWMLWRAEAEGKGYAAEAARATLAHAFGPLGWKTAVSYIDPENARSISLAERLGAVRDDAAARVDPEDVVYRHAPAGAAA